MSAQFGGFDLFLIGLVHVQGNALQKLNVCRRLQKNGRQRCASLPRRALRPTCPATHPPLRRKVRRGGRGNLTSISMHQGDHGQHQGIDRQLAHARIRFNGVHQLRRLGGGNLFGVLAIQQLPGGN